MRALRTLLVLVALLTGAAVGLPGAAGAAPIPVCGVPQLTDVPTWSGAIHQQQVETWVALPRFTRLKQLVDATGHELKIESGYRSCAEQVDLRKMYCGTSYYAIYQEPSQDCEPDTAIPGYSNHQYGLAADFSCDGILIRDNPSCQAVVRQYAPQAQLVNYSPEPWHYGVVDENDPVGDYRTDHVPTGSIDAATEVAGGVRLQGWVGDVDAGSGVPVYPTVDGVFVGATTANGDRPDVQRAGSSRTAQAGVDVVVPVPAGQHSLCLRTQGDQPNRPFVDAACTTVTVDPPRGSLDGVAAVAGGVEVRGWSFDPDSSGSVQVQLAVDGGSPTTVRAQASRPDVAKAFGVGPDHGFDAVLGSVGLGTHQVCATALDLPTTVVTVALGCATVTLAGPVGSYDALTGTGTFLRAGGWAYDPDATGTALTVRLTLDGVPATVAADGSRPDVDAATGAGPAHGWTYTADAGYGTHTVCATVADVPTGGPGLDLGCRSVTLTAPGRLVATSRDGSGPAPQRARLLPRPARSGRPLPTVFR